MYKVGAAKADITAFVKGVGMLGYGIHYNTMEGIETSLSARAFVIFDAQTNRKVCYVNCELCFITIAIKKGVLKLLERKHPEYLYDEDNLMITAQHTHSGPGGYSYYGLYNLSIPGFVMEVYTKIVEGIVEAIVKAEQNVTDARLEWATGQFDVDTEVAYNRSIDAYNLNPEVNPKISFKDRHLAVDREMLLMRFVDASNREVGSVNWFGVHTTNLPNTNRKVNFDNKGYASQYLEEEAKAKSGPDYVGVFAQGLCGDITPRMTYNPVYPFQRGQWEGKFPSDVESARYNGKLQYEKAKEILESGQFKAVPAGLDYELLYVNFTDVICDPQFTGGREGAVTGPACLGVSFFGGTRIDGPGMHPALTRVMRFLANVIKVVEKTKARFGTPEYKKIIERKYRTQGAKHIMVESNARRVLGARHIDRLPVPAWADPAIATFKYFYKKVGSIRKPWTPKVLPIQLFILGDIALAAFPFEVTTIAGKRLRASLEKSLAERGVKRVILSPYANGYSGYITTYEEYQAQIYEGGHTVFGEWSLAALQTKFDVLAKEMLKPKEERIMPHDAIPPDFTEEELNHFPFYKRAWYIRQELIKARRMERKGIHYDPLEHP